MLEKRFWEGYARPALHRPSRFWVAWKVQDAFRAGLPDVLYSLAGASGLLELKSLPPIDSAANDVMILRLGISPAQTSHMVEWTMAGGAAHVLLSVGDMWLLLPPAVRDTTLKDLIAQCLGAGDMTTIEKELGPKLRGLAVECLRAGLGC